ncbi:hypothetical protein Leryth_011393 [Lithospermum erythrorhizon]|nr:hypothetical protein Leryth_011393 [Lithospermum erythrorhizon]
MNFSRIHNLSLQRSKLSAIHGNKIEQLKASRNAKCKNSLHTKLVAEATSGVDVDGSPEGEISFTLSLFPDGYSIGKPSEDEHGQACVDIPKFLHPYDRASETLFSAIESGRLPGGILDDIPCKYTDGTLVCEVRDYRNCLSGSGIISSAETAPVIIKVCLKMSLESVVKDIPSLSDSAWTYGDLMELESRILKALQPQLCLDPTPKLDKICDNHTSSKLKLDLSSMRKKRLRQISEVTVTVNSRTDGKKICIDRMPESSRMGDSVSVMQHPVAEHFSGQNNGMGNKMVLRTNSFGSDSSLPASPMVYQQSNYQITRPVMTSSGASPAGQDIMMSYGNINSSATSVHGKRENQDGLSSPLSNLNKRSRLTPIGADGNQQHVGPQMDGFQGSDSNWKNTLLQHHPMARNLQNANTAMQKYPQQMLEGGRSHEAGTMAFAMGNHGLRGNLKEEPVDIEALDKTDFGQTKNEMLMTGSQMNNMNGQQSGIQQRLPQQFMRSGISQAAWNNMALQLDNNSRKEEQFQKRNLAQSPRVSAGGLPQSPLSSKSGEFSSGSVGPQFGNAACGLVASQKEKSAVTSGPTIGGTSLTSSANDSMQRQQQAQMAAKRRSNSLPKIHAVSGVGSPVSVSNVTYPISASSPTVGSPSLADQSILARFSKIDMVAARFQLNRKKNKVDQYPIRKSYNPQELRRHLSSDSNIESYKDEKFEMPLSRSLVGGSMNTCKLRILNCILAERINQGNSFSVVPKARTRLIMSEKPNDGTVALSIGEIENAEYMTMEESLPILPNTHTADLLASQFFKLMLRDGYHVEDHVQPKPASGNRSSSSQLSAPGISPSIVSAELQQNSEGVSSQPSSEIAKPSNTNNITASSPQNMQGARMMSPANAQALQMSQGMTPGVSMPPRPQQLDPLSSLQQQNQQMLVQQQHPQLQRSSMMLSANQMSHLNPMGQNTNIPMAAHMANKHSSLQLQMLQHQQQQAQRKMMMSSGNVGGVGNMGNSMGGLGGLGSVMNMGGVRGMGATGISTPMASMSRMGNVAQGPVNLSQASNITNAVRQGLLTQAQAVIMTEKLRMAPNKTSMLANPLSAMGGMAGARQQMHGGAAGMSMLNPTLNRGTLNPMQRTGIGPMGPPKLMSGMNIYTPQQQLQFQQQQMQLQQQQQQPQQPQQLPQQQQETTQAIQTDCAPQVGSPSNMGLPQQMNQQSQQQQILQQASPQQMTQRTPMSPQVSSGAMHSMSAGNMEVCPPSPQLSSQTLGSVGSIPNQTIELQGVNKTNSGNNA